MAFIYKRLTEITTIATTAAAVFTNPTGKTSYIRLVIVHNGNTSAETVKLYNVPDNAGAVGTAAVTNEMFNQSMAAGADYIFEYASPGIVLEDVNDTIQAITTTASKVTIQIYGGQE